MIELMNISVIYNKDTINQYTALDNVSLKIKEGEFVTIIGGNGAGKSTMMNVLSGEISVDHGNLKIDNIDVTHMMTEERSKWVSRVFQDPMVGTFSSLTLEENLALSWNRGKKATFKVMLSLVQKRQIQEVLAEFSLGLENRLSDPIGLFSGGQRQAISLLMATRQPSRLLLLDEHTAALDPKMTKMVLNLTEDLAADQKLTVLMVTHSMSQALSMGNRTIIMDKSKIKINLTKDKRAHLQPIDLLRYMEESV